MRSPQDLFQASDELTQAMSQERFEYYGRPTGWLDRFSLIEPADELVVATIDQGELGWYTPVRALRSLVPSFIDPNKPTVDTGNFFGHRIGYLYEWDDDTQIAFGIIPESFASFSWTGALVIPALLMVFFVHVIGRVSDGLPYNVWTVYLFGRLQHSFVEQSIATMLRELIVLPALIISIAIAVRLVKRWVDGRLLAYH